MTDYSYRAYLPPILGWPVDTVVYHPDLCQSNAPTLCIWMVPETYLREYDLDVPVIPVDD